MGRSKTGLFLRLYVTPGANHGGAGVLANGEPLPQFVDLLSALDAWVGQNQPPADALTQLAKTNQPPFTVTASRPMCRYPLFPKYDGAGDPKVASSFRCADTGYRLAFRVAYRTSKPSALPSVSDGRGVFCPSKVIPLTDESQQHGTDDVAIGGGKELSPPPLDGFIKSESSPCSSSRSFENDRQNEGDSGVLIRR